MSTELELGIIDRVKSILQIDSENSPLDLLILLRKHRNNFHPDLYTDHDAKSSAEAKFVEIGNMITELDSFIQRERVTKSPQELALFQPLYDNASLQSKIDELSAENERLKSMNEYLNSKMNEKETENNKKQREEMEEKQSELISIYKPTNNKIFSISFILIISGIIPILTKIEAIANIITKYAPFSTSQINTFMFIIFIAVIIISLARYIEYTKIKSRMAEIISPSYIKSFMRFIDGKKIFSESSVYSFIYGRNNVLKKISSRVGFKSIKPETINNLKDVFIYNLVSKQLVSIACADNLDMYFKIKEKPQYYNDLFGIEF